MTSKTKQKRDAILAAASSLFLERGFNGVSLDDVLKVTGGSKTTVYNYFGSKDGLFEAVILRICDEALVSLRALELQQLPLRDALTRMGVTVVNVLSEPVAVEAYRLAISEAPRHPRAARAYYEAAPDAAARILAKYLAERQAAGDLRGDVGEPRRLASLFIDSLVHNLLMQALLGIAPVQQHDAHDAFVGDTVETFMNGIVPR
ncbi:MAG TPA: TetR/AcrR family transcriptional regulator [Pantanalinema sp.]